MRTLFPYVGGKRKWIPNWVPHFPPHTLYVTVFGGSGSDILFKPPSTLEVFNDLDDDINNVFRVLRSNQDELIRLVKHTPARSRQTYHEALELMAADDIEPVQRAWAFLVASHQSLRTKHPRLHRTSGYASLKTAARNIPEWIRLPETIDLVAARFISVQLERLDFREVIAKYDTPSTFFFIDPPYHPSSRASTLYQHEMNEDDHGDLLLLLNGVQAKVWLCGYECQMYEKELRHWRKRTEQARTPHTNGSARTEVVWTNYGPVGNRS